MTCPLDKIGAVHPGPGDVELNLAGSRDRCLARCPYQLWPFDLDRPHQRGSGASARYQAVSAIVATIRLRDWGSTFSRVSASVWWIGQ